MPSTVSSLNLEPWCLVSTRRLHVQSPTWNVHIMMHVQRVRRYSTAFTTKVLNRNPECRSIRIVNYLLVYWSIHSFSHSCLDWFVHLLTIFINSSIHQFVHSFISIFIDWLIWRFVYICAYLYIYLCIYLCICLSIELYVYLFASLCI